MDNCTPFEKRLVYLSFTSIALDIFFFFLAAWVAFVYFEYIYVIFVSSVDCNRFTMSSECWMSVPLVTRMPSMVVCTLHWTVLPSFRVVLQKPQIKS
uniref:Uncharacterized protein n=1 Tax=Ixodes scapularis TaxID=6945 RepID=A0A4D5RAI6_IXOSC